MSKTGFCASHETSQNHPDTQHARLYFSHFETSPTPFLRFVLLSDSSLLSPPKFFPHAIPKTSPPHMSGFVVSVLLTALHKFLPPRSPVLLLKKVPVQTAVSIHLSVLDFQDLSTPIYNTAYTFDSKDMLSAFLPAQIRLAQDLLLQYHFVFYIFHSYTARLVLSAQRHLQVFVSRQQMAFHFAVVPELPKILPMGHQTPPHSPPWQVFRLPSHSMHRFR